jgi:hypothetical protein
MWRWSTALAIGILSLASSAAIPAGPAVATPAHVAGSHVLLLSIDGLHASDLSQWIANHPDSNLAMLARQGTTYANASTTQPSDSFPGLIAQVTGGTPKSTGVYYDDSYGRNLYAPGSNCTGTPGTETTYAENLDVTVGGNIPLTTSIDPSQLPEGIWNGKCVPIYPHNFLQVNTIFNVASQNGLYTAWSDKHPAYEIVNGPNGAGVEDLYTPEINNADDPTTVSVAATSKYDQLKVQAILNEIDGKTSGGNYLAPVPAIFGMNFQSVSVGQKLVDPVKSCARNNTGTCDPNYVAGGYLPGSFAFTPQMNDAMTYVDGAIGSLVKELQARNLWSNTELIISAKHGQSPIDPTQVKKIGDQVTTVLTNAHIGIAQNTTDDVALIWLKDQSQTQAAIAALQADMQGANTARIGKILSGDALVAQFGDPTKNNRTPDIIVEPIPGTIYSKSGAKVAEHGGFAPDDTHVALLVVDGAGRTGTRGQTVDTAVHTTQIAPTILDYLGLDPSALDAVRLEGTTVLPAQ